MVLVDRWPINNHTKVVARFIGCHRLAFELNSSLCIINNNRLIDFELSTIFIDHWFHRFFTPWHTVTHSMKYLAHCINLHCNSLKLSAWEHGDTGSWHSAIHLVADNSWAARRGYRAVFQRLWNIQSHELSCNSQSHARVVIWGTTASGWIAARLVWA